MNILFTTWAGEKNHDSAFGHRYISGDKLATKVIAEGLSELGHQVFYYSHADKDENHAINSVNVYHRKNTVTQKETPWEINDFLESMPRYFEDFVKQGIPIVKENQIELIISRMVYPACIEAYLLAKKFNIPLVSTLASRDYLYFFNMNPDQSLNFNEYHEGLLKKQFNDSKKISLYREYYKKLIYETVAYSESVVGIAPHLISDVTQNVKSDIKTEYIPDGIFLDDFKDIQKHKQLILEQFDLKEKIKNRQVCLWLNRFSPYKRPDVFADGILELDEEINDQYFFIFIGDGPFRKEIEKKFLCSGRSNFCFLLYQPNSEAIKFMSVTDILAYITDAEGLPIGLLEGMAASKALLVSDIPPFNDILQEDKNAKLIKNEKEKVSEALKSLALNPNLIENMKKNNYNLVKNYTWQKTIQKTNQLVKKIKEERQC